MELAIPTISSISLAGLDELFAMSNNHPTANNVVANAENFPKPLYPHTPKLVNKWEFNSFKTVHGKDILLIF
ncbi:MAG: hypothetical protein ABJO54_18875 [Hyphomicrobiales bacterium]